MQQLWNMWWARHSIVDLGINPLYTDSIYYPYKVSLSFHAFVILNSLISIPLQYVMGVVSIYNTFVVLSFVFSGFGAFLLLNHLTGDRNASFIGGAFYSFCLNPSHTGNLGMVHWIPFYILFLIKAFEAEGGWRRKSSLAGVFLAFIFLTDQTLFIFMALFTSLYAVYSIVRKWTPPAKAFKKLSVLLMVCTVLISPMIFFLLRDIFTGNTRTVPPGAGTETNVADLLGFLSPSPYNPITGSLAYSERLTGIENYSYIGVGLILLGVMGYRWEMKKSQYIHFWLVVTVFFGVLSLGPNLHAIGYDTGVPLPFRLFKYIPLLDNLRSPVRFHSMTLFGLMVLATFGISRLLKERRWLLGIVVPVTFMEFLIVPFTINNAAIPAVYKKIAADSQAQTVLEIPFFVKDGFNYLGRTGPITIQYYQTTHQKKIFNGYIARVAPEKLFLSYLNVPILRSLALMELDLPISSQAVAVDKSLADNVVDLFGIDYVIVHKGHDTDAVHDLLKYMLRMVKIDEDDSVIAYKTFRKKPDSYVVDAGTESSIPYLWRGWINGQQKDAVSLSWATGDESVMLLNLNRGLNYEIEIVVMPHMSVKDRRITISLNERRLQTAVLNDGWNMVSIRVPSGSFDDGLNKLSFKSSENRITSENFGDVWSNGTAVSYLRKMYLPNQRDDEIVILDWEQDNRKYKGSPISFALDKVIVKGRN